MKPKFHLARHVTTRTSARQLLSFSSVNLRFDLDCPHDEMKLKQDSVSKLFQNCFVSVSFRCADNFRLPSVWIRVDNVFRR